MTTTELILGLTAMIAYTLTSVLSVRALQTGKSLDHRALLTLGLVGLIAQVGLTAELMHTSTGMIFNFGTTAALFSTVLACVGTLSLLPANTRILGALSYMLTGIMLGLSLITFDPTTEPTTLSSGVATHVLLSLVAYSLLALTMSQAIALFAQIRGLKHPRYRSIVNTLPPLQSMETLLFSLLSAGWVALTLAIVAGWMYVDHLFGQGLAHKTILSLFSWLVFGTLMIGHRVMGWRGEKAVHWVSAGFILLILAYFGSNFIRNYFRSVLISWTFRILGRCFHS